MLVGDPNQLDAVCKSKHAIQLGFSKSLMEQFLEKKLYTRDSRSGKFNQNFITQLVRNYRSHGVILQKPSEIFYDGFLQAAAAESLYQ